MLLNRNQINRGTPTPVPVITEDKLTLAVRPKIKALPWPLVEFYLSEVGRLRVGGEQASAPFLGVKPHLRAASRLLKECKEIGGVETAMDVITWYIGVCRRGAPALATIVKNLPEYQEKMGVRT